MRQMKYKYFRRNLEKILLDVADNYNTCKVTEIKGRTVIIMNCDEFDGYQETFLTMPNPEHDEYLQDVVDSIKAGRIIKSDLSKT